MKHLYWVIILHITFLRLKIFSGSAKLKLKPLFISPRVAYVREGSRVTLNCKADYDERVPQYMIPSWMKINSQSHDRFVVQNGVSYDDCCSITGNISIGEVNLVIQKAEKKDNGTWLCYVPAFETSATANVNVIDDVPNSWSILPKDTVVKEGRSVTLNCGANYTRTVEDYKVPSWMKRNPGSNDRHVVQNGISYDDCCDVTGDPSLGEVNLLIKRAGKADNGTWICYAPHITDPAEANVFVLDPGDHLCSMSRNMGPGNTITVICMITNRVATPHGVLALMNSSQVLKITSNDILEYEFTASPGYEGANFICVLHHSRLQRPWTCAARDINNWLVKPKDALVKAGDTLTLTCKAYNSGRSKAGIDLPSWRKRGAGLPDRLVVQNGTLSEHACCNIFGDPGQYEVNIVIKKAGKKDNGTWSCSVPWLEHPAEADVYVINPGFSLCSMSYNLSYGDSALEGDNITLRCEIINKNITPQGLLSWTKDGHSFGTRGINTLEYNSVVLAKDNRASFGCRLEDVRLAAPFPCTGTIDINVLFPPKYPTECETRLRLDNFQNLDFFVSSVLNLTCITCSGNRAAEIEWYIDENLAHVTATQTISHTGVFGGTIVEQSAVVNMSDKQHQSEIRCVAFNTKYASRRFSSQTKVVLIPYSPIVQHTSDDRDLKASEGENATLSCQVNSYPASSIKWYHANGTQITGNDYIIEETLRGTVKTSTLHILHVDMSDYGSYSCMAENQRGLLILNFSLEEEGPGYQAAKYLETYKVVPFLVVGFVILLAMILVSLWEKHYLHRGTSPRHPLVMHMQPINREDSEISQSEIDGNQRDEDDSTTFVESSQASSSVSDIDPLFQDDWEFSCEKLLFHEDNLLGEGAFGEVRKAVAINIKGSIGETEVAVKMLRDDASAEDIRQFEREFKTMKALPRHPNIVALLGCCTDTNGRPLYMITELMKNGSLLTYLRDGRGSHEYLNLHEKHRELTPVNLLHFSWQIAKGMSFLESEKCLHRDLAARNVLLGDNNICKVSDFGLARDVKENYTYQRMSDGPLPLRWMAVESLRDSLHTAKSDVWSFGVLLWEIVTLGASPYPALSGKEVKREVCDGLRLVKPRHCDDELYDVMLHCWKENPSERPSFSTLCKVLGDMKHNKTKSYLTMSEFEHHTYINIDESDCEVRERI